MEQCAKCGGSRLKISATAVRRLFVIRCLRRGCGATTVQDLSISAALAGVFVRPPRASGIPRKHADHLRLLDNEDF